MMKRPYVPALDDIERLWQAARKKCEPSKPAPWAKLTGPQREGLIRFAYDVLRAAEDAGAVK